MKKKALIAVVLIIVSIIVLRFVTNGFTRRLDVIILDYSISQDESITIKTALAGSMGYIRDAKTEQNGNKLYVSFYQTFGPLNSNFGAEDTYTIKPNSKCNEIYFQRDNDWVCVLNKDELSGQWVQ